MTGSDADNVTYTVQRRFRELGSKGRLVRVLRVEPKFDEAHATRWWMVRVEIDVPLSELHHYYETLSDIEEKLENEDHLNTLIVPTIPEEQAAA